MTIDSEKKFKMDTDTNKSICPYPFTHSYIGSLYERKLCCISQDVYELKKTTLLEFWNSDKMKQVRVDMMAGKPIKECSSCYNFEKSNIESLRQQAAKDYERFDVILDNVKEDGTMLSLPNYFDHRTIYCNFQCLSCGYHYSSSHINLQKDMWGKGTDFVIDPEYEKQTGLDIIDSLVKKECKSIYWAGGEPFMSPMHWSVIEKMYELSNTDEYRDYIQKIKVHYNTNLSKSVWKNKKITELIEFYQPSIQASIDGTHETFEYCRDGGNWEETTKNWDEFYSVLNKHRQFGIASVLSSPVIMDIDRWFDFVEKYDVALYNHKNYTNEDLRLHQSFLDVKLFPQHIFDRIIDHAIDRFANCSLRGKNRSVSILQSYKEDRKENIDKYEDKEALRLVKVKTIYRDKFLKTNRSYAELLKIIDKEAYDWYMSIDTTGKNNGN
jgi:hypothetical protein